MANGPPVVQFHVHPGPETKAKGTGARLEGGSDHVLGAVEGAVAIVGSAV